jgi:hypothetical protein
VQLSISIAIPIGDSSYREAISPNTSLWLRFPSVVFNRFDAMTLGIDRLQIAVVIAAALCSRNHVIDFVCKTSAAEFLAALALTYVSVTT